MDKEEFKKEFLYHAENIKIEISEKQIEQFYLYMKLLLEWNEKVNLTAITEKKDVILKHFIDSLTIINDIKDKDKVIDVGTGAGFPGIPIKIMKPEVEMVLMDSLNKRIKILDEIIEQLELEKIKTIHGRAEELGNNKKYREQFDIATSRAVANMSTLSEYLIPFVKIDGKIICMKGSNVEEELEQSQYAINVLGGKIDKKDEIFLSNTDMKRNNIVIKKVKSTPSRYPRKAGTPAKEPIKK